MRIAVSLRIISYTPADVRFCNIMRRELLFRFYWKPASGLLNFIILGQQRVPPPRSTIVILYNCFAGHKLRIRIQRESCNSNAFWQRSHC